MCVGVLEAGWLLVESVMGSLLFKFSGCANRGLMAQKRSPFQPGRSEPGKSENWGQPSGGTDFLIARTGGDFNVPIKKAGWRDRRNDLRRRPDRTATNRYRQYRPSSPCARWGSPSPPTEKKSALEFDRIG